MSITDDASQLPQWIRGATLTPAYVDSGTRSSGVRYTIPDDEPIDSASHRSSSQAGLASFRRMA